MGQVNDKVLSAVILMQRVIPRLNANDRSTIKRQQLLGIQQSVTMALQQLYTDCKQPLVLTPLMEVVELINNVTSEESFVETDSETKALIVDRISKSMQQLYLFAGKFYMENEFTWTLAKSDVLRSIVNNCIDNGFYFGEDVKMRQEGLI